MENKATKPKKTPKETMEEKKRDDHLTIEEAIEYLRSQQIDVPEGTTETFKREQEEFSQYPHFATKANLDACIRTSEMWKPYIQDGEFNKLVCAQVAKLYRLGCSVVGSKATQKSFIGKFVKIRDLPCDELVTKVTLSGDAMFARSGMAFHPIVSS